jgi:hypothetical protein
MLPVSLGCPLYRRGNEKDNPEKLATQDTQDKDKQILENTEEAIKNG